MLAYTPGNFARVYGGGAGGVLGDAVTKFRLGVLVFGVGVVALATAPTAVADDASFLAALDRSGVTRVSDRKALKLGYGVCNDLRSGLSKEQAYARMSNDLAGLIGSSRTGTKETYFRAAIQEICP